MMSMIPNCPWCEAPGTWEKDGNGRQLVWACHSYKTERGQPSQSVECENNVLCCKIERLQAELAKLQGDIIRVEHIVAVLQTAIGQAHLSATTIEDHTRIHNGRLEVWCLGDWRDVEKANAEVEAKGE